MLLVIYGARLCRWRNELPMDGSGYADDDTRKVTTIGPRYCATFGWHTYSKWIERCCFYDNLKKQVLSLQTLPHCGSVCTILTGGPIQNFFRISLIIAIIVGAFSRVHAMPHQQDVAHIFQSCSDGEMIVVMLDSNGDPIEKNVHCPDCIAALELSGLKIYTLKPHAANLRVHQYWMAHPQRASILFDGFYQRGPRMHS